MSDHPAEGGNTATPPGVRVHVYIGDRGVTAPQPDGTPLVRGVSLLPEEGLPQGDEGGSELGKDGGSSHRALPSVLFDRL
jgi:hypothetical protein